MIDFGYSGLSPLYKAFNYGILYRRYAANIYTYYYSTTTTPLFHSGLKTVFCESFPPKPGFSSSGLTPRIPRAVYRYFGAYQFFYFLVYLFFQFSVVGSMR